VKQKRTKLSVVQECYSRAAEARRLADTAATPAERADLLAIEQRWLALARNQKSTMRLVVVMCLVLVLACAAILFLDEAADFLFWIKEWWGEHHDLLRELLADD
jgi:hypothetical protein